MPDDSFPGVHDAGQSDEKKGVVDGIRPGIYQIGTLSCTFEESTWRKWGIVRQREMENTGVVILTSI